MYRKGASAPQNSPHANHRHDLLGLSYEAIGNDLLTYGDIQNKELRSKVYSGTLFEDDELGPEDGVVPMDTSLLSSSSILH